MTSSAPRPRRPRLLALAAATFLTACLPFPAAVAAPAADDDKDQPKPPSQMSTIGGARLGEPGTQVDPRPGAGAPKLPKKLTARSWIVADAESGNVLAAHNAHWKLAPASTLKMLFADTLLPKFPRTMEYTVEREDLADVGPGSSLVGVKEGLSYTVEDLWLGVFLRSGNDAVHVLAAMNGGVEQTVKEMNAHAEELRALDTHVESPDGYDKPGQVSSAYDLTLFARSGLQKADFREYVSTVRAQFPGEWKKKGKDGEKKRKHFEIQNTNRLLTGNGIEPYPGIAGVKNGYTSNAGNTLTAVAEQDGRVLLVTVMHPESGHLEVYEEATKLFDWGFEAADAVRSVGVLVPPAPAEEDAKAPTSDGEAGGGKGNPGGSQDPDEASVVTADGAARDATGGMKVALGLIGASAVLLVLVAYVVHRRWPAALPEVSRLWRRTGHD